VAQLGWLAKGLLFVIIGLLGFALVDRDLGARTPTRAVPYNSSPAPRRDGFWCSPWRSGSACLRLTAVVGVGVRSAAAMFEPKTSR
jgi:hypothetical protein